jgi:hypothetical protein
MIKLTIYLIKNNINKSYAELAADCTGKFNLPEPMKGYQVRALLVRAKEMASQKIMRLVECNRCAEAIKFQQFIDALIPPRHRGRRSSNQTCTVNL